MQMPNKRSAQMDIVNIERQKYISIRGQISRPALEKKRLFSAPEILTQTICAPLRVANQAAPGRSVIRRPLGLIRPSGNNITFFPQDSALASDLRPNGDCVSIGTT